MADARRGDPPGSGKGPSMVVAIGVPKGGRGDPPGMMHTSDKQPGGKVDPQEAGAVRADAHCIDCKNYNAQAGQCEIVDGPWDPQDGCAKYFEPIEGGEPDADDQGGPSDNDADDSGDSAQ